MVRATVGGLGVPLLRPHGMEVHILMKSEEMAMIVKHGTIVKHGSAQLMVMIVIGSGAAMCELTVKLNLCRLGPQHAGCHSRRC